MGAGLEAGTKAKSPLILIVEDQPATRLLCKVSLKRGGYQVEEAKDGEDALALIREGERPDLIILDYGLPTMSGHDVAVAVRNYYTLQEVPIILFTAYEKRDVERTLPLVNGYLQKPIEKVDALVSMVTAYAK